MGSDWSIFTGAAKALLAGRNPYLRPDIYHAPWTFVLVAPLAWLPNEAAIFLGWLVLGWMAYREQRPDLIPVVGLSLPMMTLTSIGNIDWMALPGLAGMSYGAPFLLTIKPQATAFALVAYLHRDTWHYLVPLAVGSLLAFVVWRWPLVIVQHDSTIVHYAHNWAVGYITWPVGLWALWHAWHDRSLAWGCIASVSLSPYVPLYALVPSLYAVAREHKRAGIVLSAASWLLVLRVVLGGI
jgi:hypothetical protein